jgi:hypothetical protein
MGVFIGWWWTKFKKIRIFFSFVGSPNGQKMASFSVQTIKFIFKRLNFNSNGSITSRRIITIRRPQRQVVPPDANIRPDSSTGGTAWPEQVPAPPPNPATTSSILDDNA